MMSLFRVGEATNPGPGETSLLIGCANPTGLLGKGDLIRDLPKSSGQTIWAISETHLSRPGRSKLSKELSTCKAGYQMQMGDDVPLRSSSVSSLGGKQRGVGFLSTASCRSMTHNWDSKDWSTNRIHAACFQIGSRWVQGGVVYGFSAVPTSPETRSKTEQLCAVLDNRLVESSHGLRFIAGDFNQENGVLPSMKKWLSQGWINIQQWAKDHHNQQIAKTCKGVTTKDHIFVSPELAAYLVKVCVDDTYFKDHSCLWAEFSDLGRPPMLPLWKQPQAIEWGKIVEDAETNQFPESRENLSNLGDDNLDQSQKSTNKSNDEFASIGKTLENFADLLCNKNGKPKLSKSQQGRCQITEVKWVQEYSAPPKHGRHCDLQPKFHGINLQHAQWLRQSRRCASLCQVVKQTCGIDDHRNQHRDKLWQAILSANGFESSFAEWWVKLQIPTLPKLPGPPPAYHQASIVAVEMEKQLRTFELNLNKQRMQAARQRRHDDPNVIFRDLRSDPPQPVQMLVNQSQSTVTSVDPEDFSIEVQPPGKWDSSQPIRINGVPVPIIHSEPDKLWLEDISQATEDAKVTQEEYIGEIRTLFESFGNEWAKRWDRHRTTNDSFWDPIVALAKSVLPKPPPMECQEIGYEEWMSAVRAKKSRGAVGPDGLSKQDLLRMPRHLVEKLLALISKIEQGAKWPQQAVTGFVVALEKTYGARTVDQYRPITIFSVVFRTWGSIRAKQILRHLEPLAPCTCTGNLPGRNATQVWNGIQATIEDVLYSGQSIGGAVLDLVKAFNLLPRIPILTIMEHLQVSPRILRAWANALTTMHRRFKIHNCVGPPVLSTTGFAEGDALSVTAMLGANLACHAWFRLRFPSLTLWSYVDNIEITGESAEQIEAGLHGLQRFSDLMDIQIDEKKTYVWSSNANDRKTLKHSNFVIKHWARDLGGHMQYSLQVTNSTIATRCNSMEPLWGRLARSPASYRQKIRACKAKAWPACLHAISSVHLADEHFEKLRTGVMRGLEIEHAGASPLAHLSLVEDAHLDPQFVALLDTIFSFRAHMEADSAGFVLGEVGQSRRQRPLPGPCSVLTTRLHQIAWSWEKDTVFQDHRGLQCDIMYAPPQEIRIRLKQGWEARIKAIVGKRHTMKGLELMSTSLTRGGQEKLMPDQLAVLRASLNGTFFTTDKMRHWKNQEHNGKCFHCGENDGQLHRHWFCKAFQKCRQHLQPAAIEALAAMLPCIGVHGWIPEPPVLKEFQALLVNLPDESERFEWPTSLEEHLFLFTDGGCLAPTQREGRLATWGVALGQLDSDNFFGISGGLVPGWCQTALRGEIWAVISACKFAFYTNRTFELYIDNDQVFRKVQRFRRKRCSLHPNQKDVDLWSLLQQWLMATKPLLQDVTKVVSHQDEMMAKTEGEAWIMRGNSAADSIASRIPQAYPEVFAVWQQLQHDFSTTAVLRQAVHSTIVAVGMQAVQQRPAKQVVNETKAKPRVQADQIVCLNLQFPEVTEVPLRYKVPRLENFLAWLRGLEDPASPILLISWFQLSILYDHQMKHPGYRYFKSKKRWLEVTPDMKQSNFLNRTNSLARFIQGLYEMIRWQCKVLHVRPASMAIGFWTQCVAIRIRSDCYDMSEQLLKEHQMSFKSVRSLQSID